MIGKNDLLEWLKELDNKLDRAMAIVAVGGTAMTLLGLKTSTIDVDFCISSEDQTMFRKAIDNSNKKFRVDIFLDGYIFSEQLPKDYLGKSIEILKLKNIIVKALSPVDIIITKSARLNARDEEDIKALAKRVSKTELINRFNMVIGTYAGNENIYRANFDYVLKRYFRQFTLHN